MTDLFELARPVRDATLPELERVLGEELPAVVCEGHRLGVHLVALSMAYTSTRHRATAGVIADNGLQDLLAIAYAQLVTHAATSFRPIINGRPVPASVNVLAFLQMIAGHALSQIEMQEAGLQDFVVPFQLNEAGTLEPTPFDVREMLKGKS
jgi:hypothetical protein